MTIFEPLGNRLFLKRLYKPQNSQVPFDEVLILKHVYTAILKSQSKDLDTKFSVNMGNSWGLFFCWCIANQLQCLCVKEIPECNYFINLKIVEEEFRISLYCSETMLWSKYVLKHLSFDIQYKLCKCLHLLIKFLSTFRRGIFLDLLIFILQILLFRNNTNFVLVQYKFIKTNLDTVI